MVLLFQLVLFFLVVLLVLMVLVILLVLPHRLYKDTEDGIAINQLQVLKVCLCSSSMRSYLS